MDLGFEELGEGAKVERLGVWQCHIAFVVFFPSARELLKIVPDPAVTRGTHSKSTLFEKKYWRCAVLLGIIKIR